MQQNADIEWFCAFYLFQLSPSLLFDCLIHKTVKSQSRIIHEYDNKNYKTTNSKAKRQS